jgi:hypothetical protein
MNQNPLAGRDAAGAVQGQAGGQESDGDGGRLLEAQAGGLLDRQGRLGHELVREGTGAHRHHLVAWSQAHHLFTAADHHPRALQAEHVQRAGMEPQAVDHVAKVQTGGADANGDLVRLERGAPDALPGQTAEVAALANHQSLLAVAPRRGLRPERWLVAPSLAIGHQRALPRAPGGWHPLRTGSRPVGVEVDAAYVHDRLRDLCSH